MLNCEHYCFQFFIIYIMYMRLTHLKDYLLIYLMVLRNREILERRGVYMAGSSFCAALCRIPISRSEGQISISFIRTVPCAATGQPERPGNRENLN